MREIADFRCSAVLCAALRCITLHCSSTLCIALHRFAIHGGRKSATVFRKFEVESASIQCAAVRCTALLCDVMLCDAMLMPCDAMRSNTMADCLHSPPQIFNALRCVAAHCGTVLREALHCGPKHGQPLRAGQSFSCVLRITCLHF